MQRCKFILGRIGSAKKKEKREKRREKREERKEKREKRKEQRAKSNQHLANILGDILYISQY